MSRNSLGLSEIKHVQTFESIYDDLHILYALFFYAQVAKMKDDSIGGVQLCSQHPLSMAKTHSVSSGVHLLCMGLGIGSTEDGRWSESWIAQRRPVYVFFASRTGSIVQSLKVYLLLKLLKRMHIDLSCKAQCGSLTFICFSKPKGTWWVARTHFRW